MGRVEFRVGEAFPADDPVARWVTILSIIANDLARVNRRLETVSKYGAEEEQLDRTYWVLLGASHLREAVKFLDPDCCELTGSPEVRAFVEARERDTRELLQDVRAEFIPWDGSWLQQLVKPPRDRLFHYTGGKSGPDYSEEVGQALGEMRDLRSHIDLGGEVIAWHSYFSEEARLNWIGQGGQLSERDFRELIGKSQLLAGRIAAFASKMIFAHLEDRVGLDRDAVTFAVYVPAPESSLANRVWKGAGLVGSQVGDTDRLRVDFEGNQETYGSFKARVRRAAERHGSIRPDGSQGYPTQSCAYVDPDEVVKVGRWDPATKELEITDPEAVANWLGEEG